MLCAGCRVCPSLWNLQKVSTVRKSGGGVLQVLRVEQTTQGEVPAGSCSVSHDVATNTVQAMVVLQFSERRETNSKKSAVSLVLSPGIYFLSKQHFNRQ